MAALSLPFPSHYFQVKIFLDRLALPVPFPHDHADPTPLARASLLYFLLLLLNLAALTPASLRSKIVMAEPKREAWSTA